MWQAMKGRRLEINPQNRGPFFDVLNNLFVRAVRFSITKRVDNAHLKYEPTNLLFSFFVASNSTNQLC